VRKSTRSFIPGATSILAILLSASAVPDLTAQNPTSPPHHQDSTKAKAKKAMPDAMRMSAMMKGPHQVLAMAHRDNIATFARALRGHLAASTVIDLELARPAVAEMRRSFDQMKAHHQAQMMMVHDSTKAAMPESMRHMETHLTALGEHLSALESDLSGSTPNQSSVSEHTAAIMKECAGMSSMAAKGKPHQMP
jgi:hypothetical protein